MPPATPVLDYDVFVSHASEDKDFVLPLVQALEDLGLRPWYDAWEIRLGDDIVQRMNQGLGRSRYGLVVLSPHFFKYWPERELSALFMQERHGPVPGPRILPVLHRLGREELTGLNPLLSARATVDSAEGPQAVAQAVAGRLGSDRPRPAALPHTPLYGAVPRPSNHFTGRDKAMDQVRNLLQQQQDPLRRETRVVSVLVRGLPGIGKTELATQVAHVLASEGAYAGGIYWLDASDPDLGPQWSAMAARLLGRESDRDMSELVIRRLEGSRAPLLVVLDNVETWTSAIQPAPLPRGSHVHLLLTSRRDLGPTGFVPCLLDALSPRAARDLVCRLAGQDLEGRAGFQDLMDFLQGHTLAVELAGVFFHHFPGESPARYLEELRQGQDPEAEAMDMDEARRYRLGVRAGLRRILQALEPDLVLAWATVCRLAPEPMSTDLLEACGLDRRRRAGLQRWHLLDMAGQDRWRMHRLIREHGRAMTRDFGDRAGKAAAQGCMRRLETLKDAPLMQPLLDDLPHFQGLARAMEDAGAESLEQADFFRRLARLFRVSGRMDRARDLLSASLNMRQALLRERPDDLELLKGLAIVYSESGDVLEALGDITGAREMYGKALEICESLVSQEPGRSDLRRELSVSYNRMGDVLLALGDITGARELFGKALETVEALVSQEPGRSDLRRDLSGSYNNMGAVFKESGDITRAHEMFGKALEIVESLVSQEPGRNDLRHDLWGVYNNMGAVLLALGDISGACKMYGNGLESIESLVSQEPERSDLRIDLARTLARCGMVNSGPQGLAQLRRARDLLDALDRAGRLPPDSQKARKALERLIRLKKTQGFMGSILKKIQKFLGVVQPGNSNTS